MLRRLVWPRYQSLFNIWKKSSSAEKTIILVFVGFGFIFWLGLSSLFWWAIDQMYAVEIVGPIVLKKLIDILMLSLFGLLCFSNTVTALSTFYLSEDLELLLSLPISRFDFYLARIIDTIIQSSWMPLSLAIPILISYGIVYQASWEYYPLMFMVLTAFCVLPAAFGVSLASILVSTFPARRIREGLMLVGVLSLIFVFILLRWLQPERLANTENFESVAAYVAEIQTPLPILSPPSWASKILLSSMSSQMLPWMELSLLLLGAIAFNGIARRITQYLYDDGRTKSQEARTARMAKSNLLDRVINVWTLPLSPQVKAIVSKDIRTFLRDASQWTQLFLVASIVVIAMISVASLPVETFKGPWMRPWINALSFLILALVGFVMASLAARFQFSAVSIEGRGYWIVRTSPITAEQYLQAKLWPGLIPMLLVGEILAISSTAILRAEWVLVATAAFTAAGLSVALSGLAVGLGAMYPDFKVDNAAKLQASPAGVLYMILALSTVFATLLLESIPVYFFITASFRKTSLRPSEMGMVTVCLALTVLLWWICYRVPMQRGAKSLWERELPNG